MAIVLDKRGQTHAINLNKGGIAHEEMHINLNWTSEQKGFWRSLFSSDVDLDLGCFYKLNDGRRSVIDGLQFAHNNGGKRDKQTRQGCYTQPPYIWHTGDDRTGSSESGETILVNPAGFPYLKQIIVYTFIYEGVPKWEDTDAVVTIKVPGNEDIIVRMDEYDSSKSFCVIAKIDFLSHNRMSVEKLMTFHDGHSECDDTYHWNMSWKQGSK